LHFAFSSQSVQSIMGKFELASANGS
jgi:hypothetical protein